MRSKSEAILKRGRRPFLLFQAAMLSGVVGGSASADWSGRLYTSTLITKLNDIYFIVDCWHHRIIYSRNLSTPVSDWQILDANIAGPHSIASDNDVYVADDTGRHGLNVYKETGTGRFDLVQRIAGVGLRPHRVLYDASLRMFFVVGSADQSIFAYRNVGSRLELAYAKSIPELRGQYTRSLTIKSGVLYCVGNQSILAFKFDGDKPLFSHEIMLHPAYRGANDLFFLSSRSGLLTSTPKKAFLFAKLSDLRDGIAVDVSAEFLGTPYYAETFDGRLWIPEITEYTRIASYPVSNGAIDFRKRSVRFDFGPPSDDSATRKKRLPL